MKYSRRHFIGTSTVMTAALASLFHRTALADLGLGSTLASGKLLDLPPGFKYLILSKSGDRMSDGYVVPGAPDGMACFAGPDRTLILMRNHEVSRLDWSNGPYRLGQKTPDEAYDKVGYGGVTRTVLDSETLTLLSSNLALTGTARNCAGGISPWGWLTCEETVEDDHGFVFLCDPSAERLMPAHKIPAYGRFNHEAATVDPETYIAYLTEDRDDGCFYRFLPDGKTKPFVGSLQAMRVRGSKRFATMSSMVVGDKLEVDWVTITEPTPRGDTVRFEAQELGAAVVSRGEGIWMSDGRVYLSSTNGGPLGGGQIFRYTPDAAGGGTFELLAQSTSKDHLDMPDNITVAPWGDVYLAEDGKGDQFIRILKPSGDVKVFARNAGSGSEITGVCFDPSGSTLFLNLQSDGLTLAVRGPFASL